MIKAIIYTSNTGYTATYAKLLSAELNVPSYTLDEAKEKLSFGDEVFYFGWIMAAHVKGYKQAANNYKVVGVCGVGLQATEAQRKQICKNMGLAEDFPCFQIQGGFDMSKLHGMNKFLMKIVCKKNLKALNAKASLTPEEETVKKLLSVGGNCVSVENLKEIIDFLKP